MPAAPNFSRGGEHALDQRLDPFRVVGRTRCLQQSRHLVTVGLEYARAHLPFLFLCMAELQGCCCSFCSAAPNPCAAQHKRRTGVLAMSVVNLLISAGRHFSEWRHRQQAYAELMALDDHSLSDIGLHRSQIAGLVEGYRLPNPSSPVPFRNPEKLARPKEA